MSRLMGYELRVERPSPFSYAELTATLGPAGFEFRGSPEVADVLARHGAIAHVVAHWRGGLTGEPGSDWQVAQLARLSTMLRARLVGEDGEAYTIRGGVVEQVNGSGRYEFGRLDEILAAGPKAWSR
jgi:hypothetical protein